MTSALPKKLFLAILLIFSTTSLFAQRPTYKIGVASWIGWSFLHVAVVQHFFENEGVKVEIVWFKEPAEIEKAFASGSLHFRLDFIASVVQGRIAGQDLKLLAETNWSHGGDKIIVKKGFDLKSNPGASIGIYRDSPALDYFLGMYMEEQGLQLSHYNVIHEDIQVLLERFQRGEIPAVLIFDPYTVDAVRKGQGKVKTDSSKFPGCMPEGIYAKAETLANIPMKDQVAIIKACIRGASWINNPGNWRKYQQILNDKVFPDQPEFNTKELRAMLSFVKIHDKKILFNRNRKEGGTKIYLDNLNTFLQITAKQSFDPADVVDSRALMQALGK